MDYEKAYKEALERAGELAAKWTGKNKDFYIGDYSYIFPELRESEDEKIRKWLVDYFSSIKETVWIHRDITCEQILDWLKKQKGNQYFVGYAKGYSEGQLNPKQKEQKPSIFPPGFGEVKWNPSSPSSVKQKPVEPSGKLSRQDYLYQLLIDQLITYSDYEYLTGKKPVEWSEKDKEMLRSIIEDVTPVGECPDYPTDDEREYYYNGQDKTNWLKDLPNRFNLQPKQEWSEENKKAWDALYKHFSVIYPGDGQFRDTKLSNRQITDFLKSIRPSWKPSELEKGALRTAIHILTEERSFPKAAKQLQNILDAFEKS